MSALAHALRSTLASEASGGKRDLRFQLGTEYSSTYQRPPDEAHTQWQPLPLSYVQDATKGALTHLTARTGIFPRLFSDTERVRNKMLPALNSIMDACQAADIQGTGTVQEETLQDLCMQVGVHLDSPDRETLRRMLPRQTVSGHVLYPQLLAALAEQEGLPGSSGYRTRHPTLPANVTWPTDQGFTVVLRHRASSTTTQPFTFTAQQMREFAAAASELCREGSTAEKVHGVLRTQLMHKLVVEPVAVGTRQFRLGQPDRRFLEWLSDNSVMSLTVCDKPGPIPPEVYDVLDQVIYEGLRLPRAESSVQIETQMGASLHWTTVQGAR